MENKTTDLQLRFDKFYEQAKYKDIEIEGIAWRYMDIGNPEGKTILFLTGGLMHPMWSFSTIDLFLKNYRVIAPCYPSVDSLDALLEGIKTILEYESVENCYILGSSWGGTLAQCITYKYPDIALKTVLSNTGAYSSKLVLIALRMHLKSVLKKPGDKVLEQYRKTVHKLLSKPEYLAVFWQKLMNRFYSELFTYNDYIAMIKQQICYIENYASRLIEEPRYNGSVLIISAKDETAGTKKARDRTTSLYKNNKHVEFDTGGHAVAAIHPEEYKKVVNDFFNS